MLLIFHVTKWWLGYSSGKVDVRCQVCLIPKLKLILLQNDISSRWAVERFEPLGRWSYKQLPLTHSRRRKVLCGITSQGSNGSF